MRYAWCCMCRFCLVWTLKPEFRSIRSTKIVSTVSLVECLPKFVFARDEWLACALTQARYLVLFEICSIIFAVRQFHMKALSRLQEAGLEGVAVDFLSVDVEGVELMVL